VDEEVLEMEMEDEVVDSRVHVEVHNVEQFWSGELSLSSKRVRCMLNKTELEAILIVPTTPTLTQLDNTLRMFITFTGAYHGRSHPVHSCSFSADTIQTHTSRPSKTCCTPWN
jgi:hypothetical protein